MSDFLCPYCKHGHDYTGDYELNYYVFECNNCGKEFQLFIEYSPVYYIKCTKENHQYEDYKGEVYNCLHCDDVKLKEKRES